MQHEALAQFDYDHPAQVDRPLMVNQAFYALAHHAAQIIHPDQLGPVLDLLAQARALVLDNPLPEGEGGVGPAEPDPAAA